MKKIGLSILAVPVALTIASIPAIAQQTQQTSQQAYTYECANGKSFQAQYSTNSALVQINNQSITLPAVPAEAGQARYSDGRYLLFTTANNTEAFVEVDGDRTHDGCIAQTRASTTTTTTTTTRPATTTTTRSTPAPTPAPVRGLW